MSPRLDARSMARALGGEVCGRDGLVAPGPGHSRRDRSLSVKLDDRAPEGFVVFSHAGDDPMQCRDHVRERCGLGPRERQARRQGKPARSAAPDRPDEDAARKRAFALSLWMRSGPPHGTLVERYLAGRGLGLAPDLADTIRFHPALQYQGRPTPAMVALLRDIVTDEPCGVHRTFLTPEGEKIDRKALGRMRGAAVKFDAHEDITYGLTIGEGIETCLAARQLGLRPVWALGSAAGVGAFPVLAGIDALTVLEERDSASTFAVRRCGTAWSQAGRDVIVIAPKHGSDLNDAVRGAA